MLFRSHPYHSPFNDPTGNLCRIIERRMVRAVSYTHLDVYKRQAMRFLTAYLSVTPGTRIITGTQRMQQRPIQVLVNALREPVSYTHLDVYKRQQDPFERGIRKALNLGHTVGHAFESLALETQHPILHLSLIHILF